MTSTLFPRFAGLTWADWRSLATSPACMSWDFFSMLIWIWPERSAPEDEPEMAEVSIFMSSVVSRTDLSGCPC